MPLIYHVDDEVVPVKGDRTIREFVKKTLEDGIADTVVESFVNIQQLANAATENIPDLIILDLCLKGGTKIDIVAVLNGTASLYRDAPRTLRKAPVLILSNIPPDDKIADRIKPHQWLEKEDACGNPVLLVRAVRKLLGLKP